LQWIYHSKWATFEFSVRFGGTFLDTCRRVISL
jgi:hypothetical protein